MKKPRITAGKGRAISIHYGRLQPRDPNHGLPLNCYVCGTTHVASGLARIDDNGSATDVPLCDACLTGGEDERLLRKYLNAPVLKIGEGGRVTTEQMEQIIALADKQDTTEH